MTHSSDHRSDSPAGRLSVSLAAPARVCPEAILWTAALLAFVVLMGASSRVLASAASAEAGSEQAQTCVASQCHEYRMAFWSSPHSALDTEGLASRANASWSCAACHGEPKERVKAPGEPGCAVEVFSFKPTDSGHAKTERCQACHATDHPGFELSPHARSGVDCTVCHDVHTETPSHWPLQRPVGNYDGDSLRHEDPAVTCASCHPDVLAEFEHSEHHRLQEGAVECTDCHDPHKRQARLALGGFKQEACAKCHRDKGGPFMYEHGAQRVEGCSSCHTAHGSPNRHMLAYQNVAELCYSCHMLVPAFHARFTPESQCTACHSTIHGSNIDSHFLR